MVDNGRSGPFSGLTGVVALSARDVWAIGGLFALHWDGTEWSERALPDLDQGLGWRLDTVGAVAPSDVWFGGLVAISPFYSDVLMVRWNGSEWDRTDAIHLREQEVWPFNPRNGAPDAVLALSADDVWAVGVADGFSPATTTVGLAVHWDGSEWTEVDVPAVTDVRGSTASGPSRGMTSGRSGGRTAATTTGTARSGARSPARRSRAPAPSTAPGA